MPVGITLCAKYPQHSCDLYNTVCNLQKRQAGCASEKFWLYPQLRLRVSTISSIP